MTDHKPTRKEILRPLHLVGIALAAGIFATVVTLVSTGAFTQRVNLSIAKGTYEGLTPLGLGLVIGGASFIVTLLGLAMLMLAVDPADVTKTIDRPVLFDHDEPQAPSQPGASNADGRNAGDGRDAGGDRAPAS